MLRMTNYHGAQTPNADPNMVFLKVPTRVEMCFFKVICADYED